MKQIKINIRTESESCPIIIGQNFLFRFNFNKFGSKFVIITDSNVKKIYGNKLKNNLEKKGFDVKLLSFRAGEKSKNPEKAIAIGKQLARMNIDRGYVILSLGGGVVGDLSGFVASFYKRGVDYIQIPTTLLSQVDSSIGGKTGVNISEGKNLLGYFYHPKMILVDIAMLTTLSRQEFKNGIAEIIKYAMISDSNLFKFLEENISKILLKDPKICLKVIKKCCQIKAQIVEKDPKEKGLREILNYGHTIGHAIETKTNYRISHGRAVSLGMIYEGRISSKINLLKPKELKRQNWLIKSFGFKTIYKGKASPLIKIMKRDKKVKERKINFILPVAIGKVKKENNKVSFPVTESLIKNVFKK